MCKIRGENMEKQCIKCGNENPNITYIPKKTQKVYATDILGDEHLLVQCPCGRTWTTPCADNHKKTEVFLDAK